MKNHFFVVVAIVLFCALIPFIAYSEAEIGAQEGDLHEVEMQSEPFSWEYLATIAGASAFTLLVVQFFKFPLDKVWKIPTRLFAYFVSLIAMLIATFFIGELTLESAMLVFVNAFISALTAYGAYEITFSKIEKNKQSETQNDV